MDRGIFATASREMLNAMARYAGADTLCRQTVYVAVEDLRECSFDEFPTNIDAAIAWFTAAREKTPPEYRDELHVKLSYEAGYYDEGARASLQIWYMRPETDGEMHNRFEQYMAYLTSKFTEEEREYKRLKEKFEPNV